VTGVEVRRIRAEEWDAARTLRLEALNDPAAPLAFLDSAGEAALRPADHWRTRTAAGARSDRTAQFVAVAGGEFVGTATVKLQDAGAADYFGRTRAAQRAVIVAVYVSPAVRGSGAVDRLLEACVKWAVEIGVTEVTLDVHGENPRAEAAYVRCGFERTGEFADGPHGREFELRWAPADVPAGGGSK
jgi:RimJ/RimL family protein N-acetyltransferase